MATSCVATKNRMAEFQRVLGGGLKSRFRIILNLPSGVSGDTRVLDFMVQSTSVPSMITGVIETKYFGKTMKISGNETAGGSWTCSTLLNNSGRRAETKRIADEWQKLSSCSTKIDDYMADAEIQLLSSDKLQPILKWRIENIWVSDSGQLELDHNNEELLNFEIQFEYYDVIPLHI